MEAFNQYLIDIDELYSKLNILFVLNGKCSTKITSMKLQD